MRKNTILLSILLLAGTSTVFSQDSTKTLFGLLKPSTFGLCVAPEAQSITAAGGKTLAYGGSVLFLCNQKFGIGAAAYQTEDFAPKALSNTALRMSYAMVGGKMEYTFAPHRLFHVSIPLLIGRATAQIDSLKTIGSDNEIEGEKAGKDGERKINSEKSENAFFVLQPGLRLECNLFRYGKIYFGADYRIAVSNKSVSYPSLAGVAYISSHQLSGLSLCLGLKVGLFSLYARQK